MLCPRFAVIRQGKLIADTTPGRARAAIDGMIFEGDVPSGQMDEVRAKMCVTQAILVEGKNRVRVYEATGKAPAGFASVAATLEDAYLVMMRGNGVSAMGHAPESPQGSPSTAREATGAASTLPGGGR